MMLTTADVGSQVVARALERAGAKREDVRFFASHQPSAWIRSVVQETIGLPNARSADTFSWTGSLSSANVPLQLAIAQREGCCETATSWQCSRGRRACARRERCCPGAPSAA